MKHDPRRLDLLDLLVEPEPMSGLEPGDDVSVMWDILRQYHRSAVEGDGKLQHDAVDRLGRLVSARSWPENPDGPCKSDIMQELFAATAAPSDGPILFGQAFKRVVDLGPCRAMLEFEGFYVVGTGTSLRAVDDGPFISSTGYQSCTSVSLAGFGNDRVHKLGGQDPLEWLTDAVKSTLERHKKTREIVVVPWKPFDYRPYGEKLAEQAA